MNTTATETQTLERYPLCTAVLGAVFPGMTMDLDLHTKENFAACARAMDGEGLMLLLSYRNRGDKRPIRGEVNLDDLERVGTLVRIQRALTAGDKNPRVQVRGLARAKLLEIITLPEEQGYDAKFLTVCQRMEPDAPRSRALLKQLQDALDRYCDALPEKPPQSVRAACQGFSDPGEFADFIIAQLSYRADDRQRFLEFTEPSMRAMETVVWLKKETDRLKADAEITFKVQQRLQENQREYRLREQLRVLKEELREGDEEDDEEVIEYRRRIAGANLPEEVFEKLSKEVSKLAKTPYASAESTVLRQYLDVCLEVPWSNMTRDRRSVSMARKVLEKDHACMERVKERVLEYLAVRVRNPGLKNQILCLVGAPGTGKTSISSSIARALNRKFVRVCLGGIRDEAEIRGHRKTYIGAMPGRIVTALKQAGVRNPVILLDELDKMSSDAHGDPAAAMLEVLDAEQNCRFRDHFLELPIDLSDCIFIATANNKAAIPAPLIDRMEFIELPPYLPSEKLRIAREHLLPKQMERHGLNKRVLKVDDEAIMTVIDSYTREGGVRGLERELATICRKVAMKLVEDGNDSLIRVGAEDLPKWLGPAKLPPELIPHENSVGRVNGLAWTESGGAMLQVEVLSLPGSGKLQLTGSLGDVMKESASLAVSYLRLNAARYGIDPDFYKNRDLHIHLPEGAVPKDGPSAGIALTTALLSELSGRRARCDLAMTGEISLHGDVLPIGGLREKASAAYRAGIRTVLMPVGNLPDLAEMPSELKEQITFLPMTHLSQVLDAALEAPAV